MQASKERMAQLVKQLKQDPGLAEQLPSREGHMVRDALNGSEVYEIAQKYSVSEEAVWGTLRNAARAAAGQKIEPVESGGFGSDTDPGVTGGYGDTGFGSLDTEPPIPDSSEPSRA
jgi:hypothetical protein